MSASSPYWEYWDRATAEMMRAQERFWGFARDCLDALDELDDEVNRYLSRWEDDGGRA